MQIRFEGRISVGAGDAWVQLKVRDTDTLKPVPDANFLKRAMTFDQIALLCLNDSMGGTAEIPEQIYRGFEKALKRANSDVLADDSGYYYILKSSPADGNRPAVFQLRSWDYELSPIYEPKGQRTL